MPRYFLKGALLCAAALAAWSGSGGQPPDPATIPRLPATTGSLGNTLLRGAWSDPQQTWLQLYTTDAAVSPDGFVYLTTTWEEGLRPAGIYRDGDALPDVAHYGVNSGHAVAVGTGLVAYARTQNLRGALRRELTLHRRQPGQGISTAAPPRVLQLPGMTNDVLGLALDEARRRVYVANGARVAALDLDTGRPAGGFPVELDRAGKLAVDGTGRLWVIQARREAGRRQVDHTVFASAARRLPSVKGGPAPTPPPPHSPGLPFVADDTTNGFYGIDFGQPTPLCALRFIQGAGDKRFRDVRLQGSARDPDGPWIDLAGFADRPCGWPEEWLTLDPATPWRCLRVAGPEIAVGAFEAFTPTPVQVGRIVSLTPDGKPHGPGIGVITKPADVAYDAAHDRLLVADQGPDHQVHAFVGLDGTPRPDPTFADRGRLGAAGGWHAPPPEGGRVGPGRFQGIRGLGADAQGNVAVCAVGARGHGQTTLESYTPQGQLRWRMEGLSFLDHVDADPADPADLYSTVNRYRQDWSAPAGAGWTWTASTLDTTRFPDDARAHGSALVYGLRRIHGQRFLLTTTQNGVPLHVFRFDPATAGETAIPCAMASLRNTGQAWPPHQPLGFGPFLWRDGNGDGNFQAGEYEKILRDEAQFAKIEVDRTGNLWIAGQRQRTNCLWRLDVGAALGPGGVPAWSWHGAGNTMYALPAPFDHPKSRLGGFKTDGGTGPVFLFGFASGQTNECGMNLPLGRTAVRCRVDGNVLVPTHTTELPHNVTLGRRGRDQAYCAALAGDYLFVGYVQHMTVLVYRKADLTPVGRLDAGPQTEPPIFDGQPELVATHLPDGSYALFMPQYQGNAVTVIRWQGATTGWLPPPSLTARRTDAGTAALTWTGPESATSWIIEKRACTESGWGPWTRAVEAAAASRDWQDAGTIGRAAAYRLRMTGLDGARSDWSATAVLRGP